MFGMAHNCLGNFTKLLPRQLHLKTHGPLQYKVFAGLQKQYNVSASVTLSLAPDPILLPYRLQKWCPCFSMIDTAHLHCIHIWSTAVLFYSQSTITIVVHIVLTSGHITDKAHFQMVVRKYLHLLHCEHWLSIHLKWKPWVLEHLTF